MIGVDINKLINKKLNTALLFTINNLQSTLMNNIDSIGLNSLQSNELNDNSQCTELNNKIQLHE